MALTLAGWIGILAGCSGPTGALRFANAPIVTAVDDRADVSKKPEDRPFARIQSVLDAFILRKITRLMEVPAPRHALDVNALDEVPDSTWFENRIGQRDLTVEQMRMGPGGQGPDPGEKWVVKGTKVGGTGAGFLIKDKTGARFLLKFDNVGYPEMETGADVVVQRLLWAAGYHVPDDGIIYFSADQLALAEGAKVEDVFGNTRPMTQADIDRNLSLVQQEPDGRFRGLYSRFLPGIPIGGYAQEGLREDDPNDLIPHEERRSIRGQYVFFSWLKHTDIKEDNWLDMWRPHGSAPERHHVQHYLLDFGKALGNFGVIGLAPIDGYAYPRFDYSSVSLSFFALGLWKRPWDNLPRPDVPGIGYFDVEHYEPDGYAPRAPFIPFERRDRFDDFWAARIVARFSPELIRAAVESGRYTIPETAEHLIKTLIGRQRKIGRRYLREMAPLDRFSVDPDGEGARLCFDDVWILAELGLEGEVSTWSAQAWSSDSASLGQAVEGQAGEAPERICMSGVPLSGGAGYTVVHVQVRRVGPKEEVGPEPVKVHLARRKGSIQLIGLERL